MDGSLKNFIPQTKLNQALTLNLIRKILVGLDQVHARNYAHLDLKPEVKK